MSTLTRIAGFSLSIALHFMWSSPASASSSESDSTTADSVLAPVDRFSAFSISTVMSDDVNVALGTTLDVKLEAGKGWKLASNVFMEQKRYRQREGDEISQRAEATADKLQPGLYRLGARAADNYRSSKTLGVARYMQDIVFTDTGAGFEFAFLKPLLGATRSDLTVKADGNKGTHDFKYDRTYSGSASGTMTYVFRDVLTVTGGAGSAGKREKSWIGPTEFGPMPSNTDTLRARMSYSRDKKKTVEISYNWLKGVDRWVPPPLGNAYEILNDPSLAKEEEARNRAEQFLVIASLAPSSFLALDTRFIHEKGIQTYRVDERRSGEVEKNSISASTRYSYAARGSLKFDISTSDNVQDNGPVSLSSYSESQHVLGVGLNQALGDSISINLSGSGSLLQRFYLKQDVNPRDVDILFYRSDFMLQAPGRKLSADVAGKLERYETINIDSTFSGDNRIDYKYQIGPTVRLQPARWLSLSQDYIVKIEFTDFVHTEDKNYLNRTTTMNTRGAFKILRSLAFDFRYSFLRRDTGTYLMRPGGRRYRPTNETRENSLDLAANYEVIADLLMKARTNFRIQEGNVFGSRNGQKIITATTVYESGGMAVGVERTKNLGKRGDLSLDVSYVRNYGPYITPERKEYWEADSRLTLRF